MPGPGPCEDTGSWADAFATVGLVALAAIAVVSFIAFITMDIPKPIDYLPVHTDTAFT